MAELDGRPGTRGIYLFRHSLATNMLGANIPIKTIGDLLGHASINSTYGYTKVDLINLREASLSIAEVQHE
ncbi:MAG: tyrosine-type recombinase/integrase [Desulfuromonadaceae bacterium]